jgi:hypothetical protein
VFVCLLFLLSFSSSAWATHNRANQLTWSRGANPGEVDFTIQFVARRDYYPGPPNEGETIVDPVLNFGDGFSESPPLTVIAVDGNIIYTEGHVSHTYSGNGPFTATMGSCCRLQPSAGHVNNSELFYSVHTLVDFVHASSSPRVSVAPIVFCPTSGVCSFAFAGTGADPGNHLRWRFATPSEAGDPAFVQPGPPQAPNSATIDPVLGRYTWNTAGATLSSPGLPTYYSTQVVVEELNSQEETVSDAAADFFIALDDTQIQQPDCEDTDKNGSVDNDNDGLCDNWETDGIDSDDDGQVDFTLPQSADPNHKDAFVEIDYMSGREPQTTAIEDVISAFAAHGITLHVNIDDEVPFSGHVAFGSGCSPCEPGVADFDTLKAAYFGTAGDRASANRFARIEARRFVYHYVLYANQLLGHDGTSGIAELPGNDLTVTLGDPSWRTGFFHNGPPTVRNEAGTFMHELGHNLGLYHGGGDVVNCKPNYLSVMNYTRQTNGIIPTVQLDYSNTVLPPLDENDLNEFLGVQGPSGADVAYGPGSVRVAPADGSIDWSRSGGLQSSVAADVNNLSGVGGCNFSSPGESLSGFDDWDGLSLAFQATADFSDGVHPSVFFQEPEIAVEDVIETDSDGDGVPNIQDKCPIVAGALAFDGCPPPATHADPSSPAAVPRPAAAPTRPGPPDTRLRKARIRARKGVAIFKFSGLGGAPGLSFQCKLDRKPFKPCRSPKTYSGLKPGSHVFRVRAVDALGQLDQAPVVKSFRVG